MIIQTKRLSSGEELCDDAFRGKDGGLPNSLGLISSMNVWMTFLSAPSAICGGLTDQDSLPYAPPLWVETLVAASHLSLPSLSASLQQSFSPATTTQTRAAEVTGALRLKIFSLILAVLLEQNGYLDDVFTRDWGGLRCGRDVLQGIWQSVHGAVCSPWQLESKDKKIQIGAQGFRGSKWSREGLRWTGVVTCRAVCGGAKPDLTVGAAAEETKSPAKASRAKSSEAWGGRKEALKKPVQDSKSQIVSLSFVSWGLP